MDDLQSGSGSFHAIAADASEWTAPHPCAFCEFDMPVSERICPACGDPPPFPNVTVVERERKQLAAAAKKALTDHPVDPALLERLKTLIAECRVVICRHVGDIDYMTRSVHDMLPTHLKLQAAGLRPYRHDDKWEPFRHQSAEDLFAGYGQNIHFAALSPDGSGVPSYGEFTLVFRDDKIQHRTTFFEENSAQWWHNHRATLPKDSPAGHRCLWEDRMELAIVKLAARLESADSSFPLDTAVFDSAAGDYFEANVFGPVSLRSFESVQVKEKDIPEWLRFHIEDDFKTVKLLLV